MAGTVLSAHERGTLGEWLGRYVYVLVDPFDGIPFYVGRGVGARVAQHGVDATKWIDDERGSAGAKIQRIREIRRNGGEPEIYIARRQISTQKECNAVEASLIDVLLTFPIRAQLPVVPLTGGGQLTNAVRGEGVENGFESLMLLIQEATAPPLATETPMLVVALGSWVPEKQELPGGGTREGRGWKAEWAIQPDLQELGQSVSCWWAGLNERSVADRRVRHVVATYRSITRGLFEIVEGTWEYRNMESGRQRGGFRVIPVREGPTWDAVVGDKGHRLPEKQRGDQSAYRYWPYQASASEPAQSIS